MGAFGTVTSGAYVGEAGEAGADSVSLTCGTTGVRGGKTRCLTGCSDSGSNISTDMLSVSAVK